MRTKRQYKLTQLKDGMKQRNTLAQRVQTLYSRYGDQTKIVNISYLKQ